MWLVIVLIAIKQCHEMCKNKTAPFNENCTADEFARSTKAHQV